MAKKEPVRSEKTEMYLKAIMMVGQENPPATVTRVAEFLGVSPASVSEMVRRMEQADLVVAGGSEGITLTPTGAKEARALVRRMRLAECLLSDILGLPLHDLYDEACRLEHAISPQVEERIAAVLGDPETCPHGYPIPSEKGRVDCPLGETLLTLKEGDTATVVTLPERDSELLEYLTNMGIYPGVEVTLEEVAPFNGPLFIVVNGVRHAIGQEAAEGIRVRSLKTAEVS
ncbi:MAG: metal-dependent transcriptional regulator [Firmicutes bacterium]|nr:metal-dependent transcriptional regulator [Bacillota bacterium]